MSPDHDLFLTPVLSPMEREEKETSFVEKTSLGNP